jgi:hypothetical protein
MRPVGAALAVKAMAMFTGPPPSPPHHRPAQREGRVNAFTDPEMRSFWRVYAWYVLFVVTIFVIFGIFN